MLRDRRNVRMEAPGLAVIAAVAILLAEPAAAQWQLELEGGVMINPTDIELETDGGDTFESDLDVGGSFAVGAGYAVHDWFDLTGRFQGNFAGIDIDISEDTLVALSATAGARFYPLRSGPVRPWIGSELGWYWSEAEVDLLFEEEAKQSDHSFGINAGAGLDFPIGERVLMGVAVRYHNAFDALGGLEFISTHLRVGILFGD